jgi:transposase
MEANAQQRAKWVERWRDSGLTAKEFAAEAGLKASLLYNWSSQLSAAARSGSFLQGDIGVKPARSTTTALPRVIELPVAAVASAPAVIELLFGDVRVRVPSGFDEATLTRVVRALVGAR